MNPQRNKGGRPRTSNRDLLVALGVASYYNKPSRKALIFPEAMLEGGFMEKGMSAATLRRFNDTEECTELLRWALRETALPAREIERDFAVDATYFRTPRSELRVELEAGGEVIKAKVRNAKLHIAVGVRTKMIFAAMVTHKEGDAPFLQPLLAQLTNGFMVDTINGDKGYLSADNYEMIAAIGARVFVEFKSDSRPSGTPHYDAQFKYFKSDPDAWYAEFHKRSLVESANFIIKETNRRKVRARHERSRENEFLAAAVMHNLCRLLMVRQEFGIAIPFADTRAMEPTAWSKASSRVR